jgi:molecular chaperone HtpG
MKSGQLSVHSENLLPIIKKWLYSERDIFIRELASNASDAIQKLQILRSRGEAPEGAEPRIDITHDKNNRTLTFSDTGIGLDAEEAEKYLTQIAFSGAEEFLKTYQTNDTFIGHFGLGFFSAFIVAERVEVVSCSYKQNAPAIRWKSDGSSNYTVEEAQRSQGTDVILYLTQDQDEYLDQWRLQNIVTKFCRFFPFPVFVNGVRINEHEPLWKKRPAECTESDYLAFYRNLYPFEEPPLFWIHLNVDYPFHVQGILYFPKFRNDMTAPKDRVQLFCNSVFVSDDCKDVLPEYLGMLRGVIESPDIPLNVSRSYLQVDSTVKQLAGHIAKKVSDALSNLRKTDNVRFEKCWSACEIVVKLGMLQDEKFFQRAKEFLIFKLADGGYTSLEDLGVSDKKNIVYCDLGQENSSLTAVYRSKGIPVVVASSPLDHPLMTRLEKEGGCTFKRTDAALDDSLLDPSREKTILDASGRSEAAKIADFFRSALADPQVEVEAKSLDSNEIPALLTLEEEERRFRDYMHRVSGDAKNVQPKQRFVINTNSSLVQAVCKTEHIAPELAKQMGAFVLDLTRLTHRELAHDEVTEFVQRATKVLESLATKLDYTHS